MTPKEAAKPFARDKGRAALIELIDRRSKANSGTRILAPAKEAPRSIKMARGNTRMDSPTSNGIS